VANTAAPGKRIKWFQSGLPFVVGGSVLAATFLIWSETKTLQSERLSADTLTVVSNFATRLETHISSRLHAGRLLHSHFTTDTNPDFDAFRAEAQVVHKLFKDLQALNWVDPTGIVRITTPEKGNEGALGLEIRALRIPAKALAAAESTGQIQITSPIDLAQGGRGFVGYSPIVKNGEGAGFINIVFRAGPLFRSALGAKIGRTHQIRVFDQEEELFSSVGTFDSTLMSPSTIVSVNGREWTIIIAPTEMQVASFDTFQDEAVLILGGLLSLAMAFLTALAINRKTRLENNQKRFESFATAGSDWFWEMDHDLRFTWFSEGSHGASPISPNKAIGKKREEFGGSVTNSREWQRHLDDLATHKPFKDFEYEAVIDGATIWVRASGIPIFASKGEFLGYRGTGRDITEEKKAAKFTETANQVLAQAVEGLEELFALWDQDDRLLIANRLFRELNSGLGPMSDIGVQFEDFANATAGNKVLPEGGEQNWASARIAYHRNPHGIFEVVRTDGLIADLREQKLVDGQTITTGVDVTRQRSDERALRESEERYQLAMQHMSIWDWNLLSGSTFLSPRFAQRLGYSPDAFTTIISSSLPSIIHSDDVAGFAEALHKHIVSPRQKLAHEVRFRAQTGEYIWFQVRGHMTADSSGHPVRSNGSLVDITDRKRLEERLHRSQRLEAVGQLTGGVAHDFNNLLAVILGSAELLGDVAPEHQNLIDAIIRATGRGAELTQRLLAFSRQQPLRPKAIDVGALILDLTDMLSRTLTKAIKVKTNIQPDLWAALADPGQVENACLNLALNARDAMPDGGTLVITCQNADLDTGNVDGAMAGQYVALAVKDSGTGMSEATRRQAFEPFFTTKGVGEGSGLGLSMVYGFAQQSGGHVTIDSASGIGTTICIFLPRKAKG